jgi:hypothetical protein
VARYRAARAVSTGVAEARDALADAAKAYDWPKVFRLLEKNRRSLNGWRVGGTTWYATASGRASCVDKGSARSAIFDLLLAKRIPFIDVGMGLDRKRGSLSGMVRVTYYSAERGVEVRAKELAEMVDAPDDEYRKNIQISELNALNAALAVLRYKQIRGFYIDDSDLYHALFGVNDLDLLGESFK